MRQLFDNSIIENSLDENICPYFQVYFKIGELLNKFQVILCIDCFQRYGTIKIPLRSNVVRAEQTPNTNAKQYTIVLSKGNSISNT